MTEEKRCLGSIIETHKKAFRSARNKREEVWKGNSWKDKILKSRVDDVLKEFDICIGQ